MNRDMFGVLPDGSLYTKRRNLWIKPLKNIVTYEGYECEKVTCGLNRTNTSLMDMEFFSRLGAVGRETYFTISFDYVYIERQRGTTNPMSFAYFEGYTEKPAQSKFWFGWINKSGNPNLVAGSGWKHLKYTYAFNVDQGKAKIFYITPAYLRDVDADLYIRNIMLTYGDEDYPYTPAPEIDPTVVIT
ncbi:hypothetical protein [Ileibacterium valens]|uniref:hypothetical protein n=1 Tax=Ileibacterium valens TaxID=1862668 RepID=UPI0024B92371|nr:hypothetical protein [Ileibacterium valens]